MRIKPKSGISYDHFREQPPDISSAVAKLLKRDDDEIFHAVILRCQQTNGVVSRHGSSARDGVQTRRQPVRATGTGEVARRSQ